MPIQQSQLAAYLSRRLAAPVVIRSLRHTFPGISRETWLIEAEVADESHSFALRVDPPEGPSVPQSLWHEFQVYSRLWKSPVPVAEPLWFDEGIEFAEGRPHMIRRLVEGRTTIPGLTDDTAQGARLRQQVTFECVEKLALVHQLDWKAYGLDEFMPCPPSPQEALRAEFRAWRDIWDKGRPGPFPVLAAKDELLAATCHL